MRVTYFMEWRLLRDNKFKQESDAFYSRLFSHNHFKEVFD